MIKPVILAVDDEPQVLNAVSRDLRQQYRNQYRIVSARSGGEALEAVRQLKQRNTPVALFLADQRMPDISGTMFLGEARKLYPDAKKVLLTAYADTEAAIASINEVDLDHYLLKPWDPPEDRLYPVLDDLLDAWWAAVPPPMSNEDIRVAGTLWSPASHGVKDFLSRNRVPYQWLDIEKDSQALALLETVSPGAHRVPVIFFPDGTHLIEPDFRTLATKAGLRTEATQPFFDLIIVGAGPAGLGAAVYGASEGLHTALIEREATGGQAGTSSRIENYLGFPSGLTGADLASRATAQARRFGVEILTAREVTKLRVEDPYRYVILNDGTELGCKALVIATGVTVRRLEVPGVERLEGAGVYYGAALTEAAYFKDGHVFVVGGANSAGQGAMFFSRYASQVTMLVRGSSLAKSMSQYLIDQIDRKENIEVMAHHVVVEVHGERQLEGITLQNLESGECRTVEASALFVFIGALPHSELVKGIVECDSAGYIYTGPDLMREGRLPKGWRPKRDPYLLETSVPGIFAAGDIRHGSVKRVAYAVGQGANAIALVHQYLRTV
jgi:thioredoxin reductase (NADPH)